MGYYTYFEGEINYSNLPQVNQQVIEKVWDTIQLLQWHCTSSSGAGKSINYYDEKENEWIHFLYNLDVDKDTKVIDLSGDRKDYNEATATFLSLIAPYLDKNQTHTVTSRGEDEEDESLITVANGLVYVDGKEFQTNNRLSFPFPTFKTR
jgi:hypothetical protein